MRLRFGAVLIIASMALTACCLEPCGKVVWPAPRPAPKIPGAPQLGCVPMCGTQAHGVAEK